MGKHLTTYLSDHAAASVAMIELAKRSRENNKGTELGDYLGRIVPVLEKERRALERMIEEMDSSDSTIKNIAAWAAEKLGRLKLNDAFLGYSQLSRVVELEGLLAAAEVTIVMWKALKAHAAENPGFSGYDIDGFMDETERMKGKLEEYHLSAARLAFKS
jgi:hypothetical protein